MLYNDGNIRGGKLYENMNDFDGKTIENINKVKEEMYNEIVKTGIKLIDEKDVKKAYELIIKKLEKSSDALKREFKEEIGANIVVKNFLGISENIFNYKGKDAHELILFYSIKISDEDYKEEYIINDDCGEYKAKWIDIEEFKNKNKILYPEDVFKYI